MSASPATPDAPLPGSPSAAPAATPPSPDPRPGVRLVALSAIFVLAVASAGYWWTGTPSAVGESPHASAATGGDEAAKVAEFAGMVEKLRERMDKEPAAEGLAMLGRSYLILGKPDEAVSAYQRALKMQPQNASLLADMADAMGVKNGNSLSGAPMAFIEQALRLDPQNLKALMLAGSEAFDRNDHRAAIGYWQRMGDVGPADHPLVKQAALAIDESRKALGAAGAAAPGGGTPSASTAPAAVVAAPAGAGSAAASGARVSGTVSLAPALQERVSPDDTVFIFARPAEGSRMPLAILRRQVKDLPASFTLDDSLAMSPAARLSTAGRVIVGARISKTGNAMPQAGDFEVLSAPVAIGAQDLKLEIAQPVR